ncbi:short-chain dehydrogenase/reductase, putative [Cordyceps militaris CM01]|uniref:Short-chain dehydrogenase/reductase, putative n=1 Tax=Cordyceps militaris (strain CM01) TaxID=983644 RepID=G3JIP5_CORMM|nr:short-chain dehydrogenase/reductase, putative [Cordyceps militaris CM01]EGX91094.1 short-chain dehydrogenase/reductase, putative [Cordyceps militaris CM01]
MAKVFIVSGASKGIGAAVTRHLLGQAHKVVLTARSGDLLERVRAAHPDQVEYVAGDMADPTVRVRGERTEIATRLAEVAVNKFGRIDGVVVNHGVLENTTLADMSVESFRSMYEINVVSCFALAKAALPELRKTKGCIVWVSSGAAAKTYQAWGGYGSSKAAINSLSGHLAIEEKDITSIAIQPGRVDTDMQQLIRDTGSNTMDKAVYDTFVQAKESGGLLKPEQPGNVIARFVASPSKELSGKFTGWNSPELAAYQE